MCKPLHSILRLRMPFVEAKRYLGSYWEVPASDSLDVKDLERAHGDQEEIEQENTCTVRDETCIPSVKDPGWLIEALKCHEREESSRTVSAKFAKWFASGSDSWTGRC